MLNSIAILSLASSFTTVSSLTVEVARRDTVKDLYIVNKKLAPDGFERDTIASGFSAENASVPGVVLTGTKNSHFSINVHDQLNDPLMNKTTSIHWHGIFQNGTTEMDGAAFVSQCPITSGDSFNYNFNVDQSGTFWYHSHLGKQYADGLRGALVLYDPQDPLRYLYDVDDEGTIISLMDWYHLPSNQLPIPPTADSTLINGKGRAVNGTAVPLSVITVEKGKRYRMRLISMSFDPNWVFSIAGHPDLTIIEADGEAHQPHNASSIQIFAAQRYSFVLNANQEIGNYWIRANPNSGNQGFAGGINSAILRYKGAPEEEPPANQTLPSGNLLNEKDLVPFDNPGAPGEPRPGGADVNLNIVMGFDGNTGNFSINNVSYVSPKLPVFLQVLSGKFTAQDLLPAGSVYTLPRNKVIELSIPGGLAPGGPHPFHLHGHSFDVVRSANTTDYNYKNPPRRDVVSTGVVGDNVTIRFVTDNPGVWFLHCHIDPHLDAGLAIVFAEDPEEVAAKNPPPPEYKDLCPKYDALSPNDL